MNDVDTYLRDLEPKRRQALETVRDLIRKTMPQAEESMEYRMPTYQQNGHVVAAFASQKHYMSLYTDVEAIANHKGELEGLNLGKSCIRFRKIEDLPLDTVETILKESLQRAEAG